MTAAKFEFGPQPGDRFVFADALAQVEITHNWRNWNGFQDRKEGMCMLDDVWRAKLERRHAVDDELTRSLPHGWEGSGAWEVPRSFQCEGPKRGGDHGPTCRRSSHDLVALFTFFVPHEMIEQVSRETSRHGNEDWVRETSTTSTTGLDDDNNGTDTDEDGENNNNRSRTRPKSRWGLMPCDEKDQGARHRFKSTKSTPWRTVTPGFVLVYLGMLLQFGASGTRRADFAWSEDYCNHLPHIQNSCTRNAWKKFDDDTKIPPKALHCVA